MNYSKEQALKKLQGHQKYIEKTFGVKRFALFGSVVHNAMKPSSDIDVLVEFSEPTFDHYFDLKFYLEDLFKREVDLVCHDSLRSRIKPYVEKEVVYVA